MLCIRHNILYVQKVLTHFMNNLLYDVKTSWTYSTYLIQENVHISAVHGCLEVRWSAEHHIHRFRRQVLADGIRGSPQ